jgi:release factor glutamine methyltransferase
VIASDTNATRDGPEVITVGQLQQQSGLPLLEARMLAAQLLQQNSAWLIAHADDAVSAKHERAYAALAERRIRGEPIAYILGVREFYGLELQVTPAVLIPRPETELLVELALARIAADAVVRVLDLGTGSGAIAVALAKARPLAKLTAVDVDYAALGVARTNAKRHRVSVRFFCGDWLGPLQRETFDLIVSNPPYIAEADPHLALGDLRFEPQRALLGGVEGLDCIRAIVVKAKPHLAPGAWLLFEHGYDQAEACRALLEAGGYGEVQSWPDLAGIPRVSGGSAAPVAGGNDLE